MKILFVCTGNTCRSPMAQALCQFEAKNAGFHTDCDSAGLFANPGEPISLHSAAAIRSEIGENFTHFARQITGEIFDSADLVVAMTRSHQKILESAFGKNDKIISMPDEIPDPYGSDEENYLRTARAIRSGLRKLIEGGVIHG